MVVIIDGKSLTIDTVLAVARNGEKAEIASEALDRIQKCREFIEDMVEQEVPIYGVTTGIGEFARIQISKEQGQELQKRIVYSHAAAWGAHQPIEVVRGGMLIRANVLCKGHSGVRPLIPQTLVDMLNKGVTPVVYEKGSVGTSGDLAPLSHVAEVVMGEGDAYYQGEVMPGGDAMRRAGIEPVKLSYKEGLGIINGPQMMTSGAAILIHDAEKFMRTAMLASAMSIDALRSVDKAFDSRLHALRGYPGQMLVAENLRSMFQDSQVMADKSGKVQDGYSLRCTPQVLGPTLDILSWSRKQIEIELNAGSDNPLFFPDDGLYLAGGNFHGQGTGLVMDYLAIALSEVGDLSERHINRLLNPVLSGLPDFLVEGKGLNSGLMVAQYTAAALVSENKVLSHPASVDSISVSADQED
ncbi:MAG: histidine ammonia-lyase, partial [Candidatus Thermoplasmatota archaeon]|nr:histidine ammonia-lyase [Candidatus Thermoplasmatota archaeon]